MRAEGVTSVNPPPSGTVKKRACRWGGGERKMHESKLLAALYCKSRLSREMGHEFVRILF